MLLDRERLRNLLPYKLLLKIIMSKRNVEFKIGIMVLAVIVVLVFLVIQFGRKSFVGFGETYEITVRFDKATGINPDTPVYKSGVKIGNVRSVDLVDDTKETYTVVKLAIQKKRSIYTNEFCRINSPFINLNETTLEIVKDKNYPGAITTVKPGELIRGMMPVDMLQSFGSLEGDLTGAIQNISDAAAKAGSLIESINAVIGTPAEAKDKQRRFEEIVELANDTMGAVNQLAGNVNDIFADRDFGQNVRKIIKDIPPTLEQVRSSLGNINSFADEARTTMGRVNLSLDKVNTNLDNIGEFTAALGDNGSEVVKTMQRAARRMEGMFSDISELVGALRNPDGSLAQLINNPELYESVQATIENVEDLSQTLKPIVYDMRVFSDKIARDPSVLGVRGAISKSPPLKGLPYGDGVNSDGLYVSGRAMRRPRPSDNIIAASYVPYQGEEPFDPCWKNQLGGSCGFIPSSGTRFEIATPKSPLQKALDSVMQRQCSTASSESYPSEMIYEDGMSGCGLGQNGSCGSYDASGSWDPSGYVSDPDGFAAGFSESEMGGSFANSGSSGTVVSAQPQYGNAYPSSQPPSPVRGNPGGRYGFSPILNFSKNGASQVAPVPALGRQNNPNAAGTIPTMPTTILEFRPEGATIEGSSGEVIENQGSGVDPGNGVGVTFPTKDKGYIIEFETGIETGVEAATPQAAVAVALESVQSPPVAFATPTAAASQPQPQVQPQLQFQPQPVQTPAVATGLTPQPRFDPRSAWPQYGSVRKTAPR